MTHDPALNVADYGGAAETPSLNTHQSDCTPEQAAILALLDRIEALEGCFRALYGLVRLREAKRK